jgi:regulator of protease activity HflC (stomatin/prohibitin superfamily)
MTQANTHHASPETPSAGTTEKPAVGLSAKARERIDYWTRKALVYGVPTLLVLLSVVLFWKICFVYVPPHRMLVITTRTGQPLPEGRLLAKPGEKGVQREVLGEGWHFFAPLLYTTELHDCIEIPPGKVGIVTALDGDTPPAGRVLALQDNEKGIRREVLTPGTYRLNPHGFTVEIVDAVEVTPGFVGVVQRLLGKESTSSFANNDDEKGLLRDVLQPGLYYVNTREYSVHKREVGIYQTTFHYHPDRSKNTALTFRVKDGNQISLDCTIEWEVLPRDAARLAVRYQNFDEIEERVVKQAARQIVRQEGFNFGAQEFLQGDKREQFQNVFQATLKEACSAQGVQVGSAYIRNIVIPDSFLEPKRKTRLAEEKALTGRMLTETIRSDNEVERERSLVTQEAEKVKAGTTAEVALIDQETANIKARLEVDLEAKRADYRARIAKLEAQRSLAIGSAEAEALEKKQIATNSIYEMKRKAYEGDVHAFLKASLAEQLNPKITLRLYQSGPGTFWTNLGDKSVNLMLQAPNVQPKNGDGHNGSK